VLHSIDVTRYRDHLTGQLLAVAVEEDPSGGFTIDGAVTPSQLIARLRPVKPKRTLRRLSLSGGGDMIMFPRFYYFNQTVQLVGMHERDREELIYSSSLPNTDIVSPFTNLMSPLRLPMRNSFQSAVTKSLTFFPNGQTFLIIFNLLTWLAQMRKISLRSQSPWRSTS